METVLVKPSPIHGKGLFAGADFKQGDRILMVDESRLVTDTMPLPEGEHAWHCDWLPDGRVVLLPEPERYRNHSCDSNAYDTYIDGVRFLVGRQEIRAGEEITGDYRINGFGDTVWECNCGSEQCGRTIHSDFFHLPRSLQIEYLPYLTDLFQDHYKEQVDALIREARA